MKLQFLEVFAQDVVPVPGGLFQAIDTLVQLEHLVLFFLHLIPLRLSHANFLL